MRGALVCAHMAVTCACKAHTQCAYTPAWLEPVPYYKYEVLSEQLIHSWEKKGSETDRLQVKKEFEHVNSGSACVEFTLNYQKRHEKKSI